MSKKLLSIVLALVMALVMLPMAAMAAETGDTLTVGTGGDYATLAEAMENAKTGDTIKLLSDITSGVFIDVGANCASGVTFDLNQNELTLNPAGGSAGTETNGFRVALNTTATVKNGTVVAAFTKEEGKENHVKVAFANYGTLNLENLVINHSGDLSEETAGLTSYTINNGGTLDVVNCEITNTVTGAEGDTWVLTHIDYGGVANRSQITIDADSVLNGDISVYEVADNSNSKLTIAGTLNGKICQVDKNWYPSYTKYAAVEVTGGSYTDLASAFAYAVDGAELTLLDDVNLTETLSISKAVALELNGKAITADIGGNTGAVYVGTKGSLTITDEAGKGSIANASGITIGNYGTVTLKGGALECGDNVEKNAALYNFCYQSNTYGTAVIEGGSVETLWNSGDATISGGTVTYVDSSAKLNVTGGEIGTLIVKVADYAPATGTIATISDAATVTDLTAAASIGNAYYATLQAAFDAAETGDTIEVLDDITIDEDAAYHDGSYIEGVYYTGSKSFTVDFNGNTVTDNGCVNDNLFYLSNFIENAANEITFKNGTLVATVKEGNEAPWSVICVSHASKSKSVTTLNLDSMKITLNVEEGAKLDGNPVVRARNSSVINVNDGTEITSNGASAAVMAGSSGAVINIKDGAKLVQKNSSTASGNNVYTAITGTGTVNMYEGAEVTSDNYGVYPSTTGIHEVNIYGGTLTAENAALAAWTNGGADQSTTINVYGGTITGDMFEANEDCFINITGGTFSVDPSDYVASELYAAKKAENGWTVASIGPDMSGTVVNVNAANAQLTLDGAFGSIDGKTIHFTESVDEVLALARPTKYEGSNTVYYNYVNYKYEETATDWSEDISSIMNSHSRYERTIRDITFTAADGVTLAGFNFTTGHDHADGYDYVRDAATGSGVTYYDHRYMDNITFDGLTITGDVYFKSYMEDTVVQGISFENCAFTGETASESRAAINMTSDTNYFQVISVENCSFNDVYQGMHIQGVDGLTVKNNTITNTDHNAIAIQSSHSNYVTGVVTVTENYIEGAGDRAIRIGDVDDAVITINNNVMIDAADGDGQMIKASSLGEGAVDLENNYWDDADLAVAIDSSLTAPEAVGLTAGTWDADVSDYVAEGYEAALIGGSWLVRLDKTLAAPVASVELNEAGLPVISWDAVEGTDYYYVYRNTGDNLYNYMGRTAELSIVDTKADFGTEYGYMVRAVGLNEAGQPDPETYSAYSAKVFITAVKPIEYAAEIDGVKYETLAEAIAEVEEDQTIVLLKNIDEEPIEVAKDICFYVDGNGFHVNANATIVPGAGYKVHMSGSPYDEDLFVCDFEAKKLATPEVFHFLTDDGLPQLQWLEVEDADYYYIYRTAEDGKYYYLTRTTELEVIDTTAVYGTEYGYMVRAVGLDEDGNLDPETYSDYSSKEFITAVEPVVEPLDAPVIEVGLDDEGLPVIAWDEVEGADYYYVFRNAGDGYYYYLTRTTGLEVTDSGAEYGTEYGYMVRAVALDKDGNPDPDSYSPYSTKEFITATKPALAVPDVTLDTENSTGLPVISWDEVDGADRYYVYRSDSKNGSYYYVGFATDDDLVDTEAEVGCTYWYIVRAVALDENGKPDPDSYSEYSAKQSVVCVCARPDVSIMLNSQDNPKLSWDEVDGAERYYIYRSTSKWSGYSLWTWTSKTSIVNNTDDVYYYQVLACDRDGDEITYSAPSTPVCLDD